MTLPTFRMWAALDIMAKSGLANTQPIYDAAATAELPLPAACALMEKESGGRNVYGHDPGAVLSGFPGEVNRANFEVYWWLVQHGQTPNGVGPAQLTFPGFIEDMLRRDQQPWNPTHNAAYGFGLLAGYHRTAVAAGDQRPWVTAGTKYNGALTYGIDLSHKLQAWRDALTPARVTP